MPDIDITDAGEIPCLPDMPHVCTPTTSLADFAYELANQAWSCLANTPNGLPSGFYCWMDDAPKMPGCCDELVVSITDSRRFKIDEFGKEILNVVEEDHGQAVYWQHELLVQLSRPCISLLNHDGTSLSSHEDRQRDAYNFLVDVQTLICCLEEWLIDENANVCGGAESYYFRPASYDHYANCATVEIPIVFGGDGFFRCNCCDEASA